MNGEPGPTEQAQTLSGNELAAVAYHELRDLAAGFFAGERRDHTLQPTAVVHEAYLRIAEITGMRWRDRTHFLAFAAEIIRRVLVDYAKGRGRKKRGGGRVMLQLSSDAPAGQSSEIDVLDFEEVLAELATLNARHARIVELRFFGGLSVNEVAAVLDVSPRTVAAEWAMAKAWLATRLSSYRDGR